MRLSVAAVCCLLLLLSRAGVAGDWSQWRGSDRNGVAADSPQLIDSLPESGLKPVWTSEPIGSGKNDGGWGSPVVASVKVDGKLVQRVFLFTHQRIKIRDVPKKEFPWLAPDKRVGMTAEEYAEYERKRRDEDEFIAKSYVFRETVFGMDADTGKTAWKNVSDSLYTRFPQSGSPTVVDGRLYILGAGRHVRCIDAATGADIWNERLPGDFRDEHWASSFVVIDDVAVFLAGNLFAVSTENGKLLWEGDRQQTRGTHTSPVVWEFEDQPFVIVNVGGGSTVCVDPKTGKEVWRVQSEAGLSTPVITGDLLITYGNSRKKGLRCFRMSKDGAEHLWTYNGCQDKGSSPVVVGEHVYVQGEKRLACVNLETGRGEWMTTLDKGRPQYTSLVAADEKVFYALEGMLCFAATPEEFTPLIDAKVDSEGLMATEASFRKMLKLDELDEGQAERKYQSAIGRHGPVACASPAIANGRIYLRLRNAVTCYDLTAK